MFFLQTLEALIVQGIVCIIVGNLIGYSILVSTLRGK